MLTLDGSITSSVTTLPGTALNGSGLITGNVTVGGLLGPGDMIGTIEVVGNVTFQTGSTFQVQADPSTADVLDVVAGGNITIEPGATIFIIPTPATYRANTAYNVALAEEGGGEVIGTFDNVVNTFPAITASVLYTTNPSPMAERMALGAPNQITLLLNFMPFSSIVDKGNPGALAKTFNDFIPPENSDMDFVIEQLYFLPTTEALISAFNQMQPSLLNSISLAQQNSTLFVSSAFTKHTSDLRLTRSPCTELGDKRWEVWGDGSSDWAWQRGNHQNVGFHASTQLGAGGFDYRINNNFYLGILGAYTYTSINCKDHLAKGTVNTYYTGLYGSLLYPRFFANLSLVGDFADYQSKRRVRFGVIDRQPHGHHHGYGAIAHLDLGASLPAERRAQCYPYGALDYVYQHEKGYTETKAQSLNNTIRARNTTMLRSELGLQGRYCGSIGQAVIIPSAKIGWVYEARFQGEKINARLVDVPNRYTVVGLYPNRDLLTVGASLTGVLYKQTVHLSLTYEGLFGSGYRSNAGNLSLNLQF
jgi:outer membrane autotransporter protein